MPTYRFSGTVKITYTWLIVNEVAEGDDQEDAMDGLLDKLEPHDAFDTDYDTYSLALEAVEPSEAQRMAALGMPVLPGLERQ